MVIESVKSGEQVVDALGGQAKLRRLTVGYVSNVRAYSTDLPNLLRDHKHEWAVYSTGKLIGVVNDHEGARRLVRSSGLKSASVLLRFIDEPGKAHYH